MNNRPKSGMKKNKNLTSLSDHLDKQYGKRGTAKREEFEEGFQAFKLEVLNQKQTPSHSTKNSKFGRTS